MWTGQSGQRKGLTVVRSVSSTRQTIDCTRVLRRPPRRDPSSTWTDSVDIPLTVIDHSGSIHSVVVDGDTYFRILPTDGIFILGSPVGTSEYLCDKFHHEGRMETGSSTAEQDKGYVRCTRSTVRDS